MSNSAGQWDELSSRNERLVQLPDPRLSPAPSSAAQSPTQWAELASQGERLVDTSDPVFQLAPPRQTTGLRLVTGAA